VYKRQALGIVILAGVVLLSTSSLFSLLISFETLLLTSLFLLRLTSKSERVLEAVLEMLLWTLVGSVCLLLSFGILLSQGILDLFCLAHCSQLDTFVGILLITGFGVKIPVWPFFSWLLKAHVEASVEFSILLSGLIVKLGIFALARFLPFMAGGPALLLLVGLTLISISEATFRLFAQRDLKRIVALTTIIEMNWLTLCLAIGTAPFLHAAALIAVAHSFSTISEFFLVECISRRFNSRDSAAISSLATQAPLL
jgi:formate hydrogenlyase subunit 3/multisubunit Na+/H+ antiporter MnhD subunit